MKEKIDSLFFLFFTSLIGLSIGFGFYTLSIFLILFILTVNFLIDLDLISLIKKIWKKQK